MMTEGEDLVPITKKIISTHKKVVKDALKKLQLLCAKASNSYTIDGTFYTIVYSVAEESKEQFFDNGWNTYNPFYYQRKSRALVKKYWLEEKGYDKIYRVSWVVSPSPSKSTEEPWKTLHDKYEEIYTKVQDQNLDIMKFIDAIERCESKNYIRYATQFSYVRRYYLPGTGMFAEKGGEIRGEF